MYIVIPTYGRTTNQTTYWSLTKEARLKTTLVVQHREWLDYWQYSQGTGKGSGVPFVVLPPHIQTVGPTRQWIIENFSGKVLIMDDDLVFATRRPEEPTKFLPSTGIDINAMLREIEVHLDLYPVVGLCPREGGNRKLDSISENTRIIRVTGLDTDVLNHYNVRYDRTPVMEDFDMTLQMLKLGLPNICLNMWVHNQYASNSKGGCSTYRTPALQTEAANKLHELHKPFVKVVKKTTKTAWGGGERTDVVIQWKKAYKFGQANLLDQRKIQNKEDERSTATQAME